LPILYIFSLLKEEKSSFKKLDRFSCRRPRAGEQKSILTEVFRILDVVVLKVPMSNISRAISRLGIREKLC